MNGEYASIAATTTRTGTKNLRMLSARLKPRAPTGPTCSVRSTNPTHLTYPTYLAHPTYSVITGSNVHSDSVTNTTSNAPRIAIHIATVAVSGGDCSNADVPRTPAIITGIVIGYKRIGSITSRERARTSIAANSVPTAANPTVPAVRSAPSSAGSAPSGERNRIATSGTSSTSTTASSSTMPSILPT